MNKEKNNVMVYDKVTSDRKATRKLRTFCIALTRRFLPDIQPSGSDLLLLLIVVLYSIVRSLWT